MLFGEINTNPLELNGEKLGWTENLLFLHGPANETLTRTVPYPSGKESQFLPVYPGFESWVLTTGSFSTCMGFISTCTDFIFT